MSKIIISKMDECIREVKRCCIMVDSENIPGKYLVVAIGNF